MDLSGQDSQLLEAKLGSPAPLWVTHHALDPIFTRLLWSLAPFCQGPSMPGLGVEKLLEGAGRGSGPACSRSECDQEKRQPTQTEPQEDTRLCTRLLHMHPLGATEKYSDAHPEACNDDTQGLDR